MRIIALAALCLTAACAGPLEPPAYPAPDSLQAERAYKAAFHEDLIERAKEPDEDPKDGPNAANGWVFQMHEEQRLGNEQAVRAYGAFRSLRIKECAWERYKGDVPSYSRARVPKRPDAIYRCGFSTHYQINPPHGDQFDVEMDDGAFFQRDGAWTYLGRYENPY